MVSKTSCKRCGRLGNFNEVKLYPLPHDPSQSMFLCEACYRKMIFEKNREKIQTKPCHQCGRIIPADARLCPYCGLPLRSEGFRGSHHLETMCGFCGARFVGSPTVCPSCGKRIMQVPGNQDLTWTEGKRVTKKIILLVILIVGVVVGAIIFYIYMINLTSVNNIGDVEVIDFKLTNCQMINHNSQVGMLVLFSSNVDGEIRIVNENRVFGYAAFSSSDTSKIIDIGNNVDNLGFTEYSVVVIYRNNVVFFRSYFISSSSFWINSVDIRWSFENDIDEDMITYIEITLSNKWDLPINFTGINLVIDATNGPFRMNFQNDVEVLLPGETRSFNIITSVPGVSHREIHQVSLVVLDPQMVTIGEYIGDFRV